MDTDFNLSMVLSVYDVYKSPCLRGTQFIGIETCLIAIDNSMRCTHFYIIKTYMQRNNDIVL